MKAVSSGINNRTVAVFSTASISIFILKIVFAPLTIPRYIPVLAFSAAFFALFVLLTAAAFFLKKISRKIISVSYAVLSFLLFVYLIIEVRYFFPIYYAPNPLLSYSYLCSILIAYSIVAFSAFSFHVIISGFLFLTSIGYFYIMNRLKFENIDLLLVPILVLLSIFIFTIFHLIRILYSNLQMERKLSRELAAAKEKIINQEKIATLATFAAGTAHEINNPITYMYGNIEYLEGHLKTLKESILKKRGITSGKLNEYGVLEDMQSIIDDYRQGFTRVIDIVNNMKQAFRQKSNITDEVDLAGVVYSSIDYLSRGLEERIGFDTAMEPHLMYRCNAGDFLSVFQILISNAIEAMEDKGIIRIRGHNKAGTIRFIVEDNGQGMDEEVLRNCYRPFFSTKNTKCNMGIGLTLCKSIIEQYGGTIRIESEKGAYTRVALSLPL